MNVLKGNRNAEVLADHAHLITKVLTEDWNADELLNLADYPVLLLDEFNLLCFLTTLDSLRSPDSLDFRSSPALIPRCH